MSVKVVPIVLHLMTTKPIPGSAPTEFRNKEKDIAKDLEDQLNEACPPGGHLVSFLSSSERKDKFLAVFNIPDIAVEVRPERPL